MKLVMLILIPGFLFAQVADKPKPPVRYHYEDGSPIPLARIPIIYDKDCDPNGWKFDRVEWMKLRERKPERPRYYRDSTKGSNGGFEIG